MAKTKPIGVRFDEDILNEIGGTAQSVLITLESFYRTSRILATTQKEFNLPEKFIPQPRQLEPPELIGMEKMFPILEIEKQIAAIKSEIKPSIIPKANWERSKKRRISELQNQLK